MQVLLLRHGKTRGNLLGRYIGRTDEPLCEEGRRELTLAQDRIPPGWEGTLWVSPMLRCVQTAQLLFPGRRLRVDPRLREMDFGVFEGKTYRQLQQLPSYCRWLDSGGRLCCPGGESREEMSRRCGQAFGQRVEECLKLGRERCAFVVHGGTIMAVMERFAFPRGEFYSFQVKNGEGYLLNIREERWESQKNFSEWQKF